jgi:hypothetical protein
LDEIEADAHALKRSMLDSAKESTTHSAKDSTTTDVSPSLADYKQCKRHLNKTNAKY